MIRETAFLFLSILIANAALAALEAHTGQWPFYARAVLMLGFASAYVQLRRKFQ